MLFFEILPTLRLAAALLSSFVSIFLIFLSAVFEMCCCAFDFADFLDECIVARVLFADFKIEIWGLIFFPLDFGVVLDFDIFSGSRVVKFREGS